MDARVLELRVMLVARCLWVRELWRGVAVSRRGVRRGVMTQVGRHQDVLPYIVDRGLRYLGTVDLISRGLEGIDLRLTSAGATTSLQK